MSETKPEVNAGQGKGADASGPGPSRRQMLKAAAAATPIIMSLKGRPAFAADPQQTSASLSHNLSAQPTAAPR